MEGTSFTSTICAIFEIAKLFKIENFSSTHKCLILHIFKSFSVSNICFLNCFELLVMSASDYVDFNCELHSSHLVLQHQLYLTLRSFRF